MSDKKIRRTSTNINEYKDNEAQKEHMLDKIVIDCRTQEGKTLAEPVFFDLRNVYEPEEVARYGIDFIGVGVLSVEIREVVKAVDEAAVSEEE